MSEPERTTDGDAAGAERTRGPDAKTCTDCGALINEYEWFPIRGRPDDDGEIQIYSFCSEECVESWEES